MSQMTEEAVDYFRRNICVNCSLEDDCNGDADCLTSKAFVEGITMLENRLKEAENQIKLLEDVNKELEKERLRIIGVCSDREEGLRRKIADLEKQIEKLKKCDNCKENTVLNPYCIDCENHNKWELAE